MLRALFHDGLLAPTDEPANAQVFVKYKSAKKAALIVNMVNFNRSCASKARRFRLPTLEGLAASLRSICSDVYACKIDLRNCYWSIHLPPDMLNCIRVAAATDRYAFVRVPFGWHQAPGLVQHLIARVLETLPPSSVLIIQYLDDILFVGPRDDVQSMAQSAAHVLQQQGYLISPKSDFTPSKNVTWMGKALNLSGPRIAPSVAFVADVVSRWLTVALRPYRFKSLQRLLGKLFGWGDLEHLWAPFLLGRVNGCVMDLCPHTAPPFLWSALCWRQLQLLFEGGSQLCPLPPPRSVFLLMLHLIPNFHVDIWWGSGPGPGPPYVVPQSGWTINSPPSYLGPWRPLIWFAV